MLFTCIKPWFFRKHLANFNQISHWSFCWNVIDSLFKWSCSIDCQAHIFFFKTKTAQMMIFSLVAMIGLEKCCITSAVATSLRWANRGPWASCCCCCFFFFFFFCYHKLHYLYHPWISVYNIFFLYKYNSGQNVSFPYELSSYDNLLQFYGSHS